MILDKQNLFSWNQTLNTNTATVASENVIDLAGAEVDKAGNHPADVGRGNRIRLFGLITETVADTSVTGLTVTLQTDADEAFGSAATLWTFTAPALTAGTVLNLPEVPTGCERYLRLLYTPVGADIDGGTGKVSAGVLIDNQDWAPVPAGKAY
jgi:hypothetical protein